MPVVRTVVVIAVPAVASLLGIMWFRQRKRSSSSLSTTAIDNGSVGVTDDKNDADVPQTSSNCNCFSAISGADSGEVQSVEMNDSNQEVDSVLNFSEADTSKIAVLVNNIILNPSDEKDTDGNRTPSNLVLNSDCDETAVNESLTDSSSKSLDHREPTVDETLADFILQSFKHLSTEDEISRRDLVISSVSDDTFVEESSNDLVLNKSVDNETSVDEVIEVLSESSSGVLECLPSCSSVSTGTPPCVEISPKINSLADGNVDRVCILAVQC